MELTGSSFKRTGKILLLKGIPDTTKLQGRGLGGCKDDDKKR